VVNKIGLSVIAVFAIIAIATGLIFVGSAKAIVSPETSDFFKVMQQGTSSDTAKVLSGMPVNVSSSSNANSSTGLVPQIIKSTYLDSSRSSSVKEMNFEKGDTIYVRIEIFDPNQQGDSLIISDRVFNFTTGTFKNFRFIKSDGSTSGLGSVQPINNKMEFSVNAGKGINKIEYEYQVED